MAKNYLRSDMSEQEAHFFTSGSGLFGEENTITGLYKLVGKFSELEELGQKGELSNYAPDSKSRNAGYGNVIEAERLQLMTRDICMSTISLFIMTLIALGILEIVATNKLEPLKMLAIPLVYLVAMFFVSRAAAKSRANRFVAVVVKNAVINDISN